MLTLMSTVKSICGDNLAISNYVYGSCSPVLRAHYELIQVTGCMSSKDIREDCELPEVPAKQLLYCLKNQAIVEMVQSRKTRDCLEMHMISPGLSISWLAWFGFFFAGH